MGGGGSLTSLMRVGRAKLETDRIIMQGKDTGLKMVPCSSDRFVVGENGETKKCVCELKAGDWVEIFNVKTHPSGEWEMMKDFKEEVGSGNAEIAGGLLM